MQPEIVILAAGQGTRMKSSLPKVLHKLAGKPLLQHVISTVNQLSKTSHHVIVGYGAEHIKQEFQNDSLHWIEQPEQLGTGHAVTQALPFLSQPLTLILYGDVPCISVETLRSLLNQADQTTLSLLTISLDNPTGYGRIVRDDFGSVQKIVEEKDATADIKAIKEINTGIMVVPTELLKEWLPKLSNNNAQQEYYLTDIIAMAIESGIAIKTVSPCCEQEIQGVNDKIQLANLERWLQQCYAEQLMLNGTTLIDPTRLDIRGTVTTGQDVVIDCNAVLEGDVLVGNNSTIGPNVVIKNSVIGDNVHIDANCVIENSKIGDHCQIGPFARIRPDTVLEESVKIGNFVETKKSTIGIGSKVNHLSYVGDSLIGQNVNVGAGTITCNYDGANKHQTVIEDNVFIGSNTAIVAPIIIEKNATIGAGSTITKKVYSDELALTRAKQLNLKNWLRPTKKTSQTEEH